MVKLHFELKIQKQHSLLKFMLTTLIHISSTFKYTPWNQKISISHSYSLNNGLWKCLKNLYCIISRSSFFWHQTGGPAFPFYVSIWDLHCRMFHALLTYFEVIIINFLNGCLSFHCYSNDLLVTYSKQWIGIRTITFNLKEQKC